MSAFIRKFKIMKLYNLLIGEQLSMEIAQLCKITHNNQLQQSIYLSHQRNMSQIWKTPNQCSCQVTTSYTLRFLRYSPDKILLVKVTAERSNQDHTMMLHTYKSQPIFLPRINFLHLTVSEIQAG